MSTYPLYRKSKRTGTVVKFVDKNKGYVVEPGDARYNIGSLHDDWQPHTANCWEPYDYVDSGDSTTTTTTKPKTPDQLELFESTIIKINTLKDSTITKVPNGYVMTSSSGHQLFIKDLSKDSL